jgi:hypothetical protein
LPFLDEIALPNRKRFHDAAIPVLDFLQVLVDLHGTGGDDGAFQLRDSRPSAAACHQQNHHRQTTQHPWPQPEEPFRGMRGSEGQCAGSKIFRTVMFLHLISSVALGEANGELKLMMSGNFGRVTIISVGPVVHIDERYIVAVDLLRIRTGRLSPSADR